MATYAGEKIAIVITLVGKEWTIVPKEVDANDRRFEKHKDAIKTKWDSRHPKKPTPDHRPIVFLEGDTLEFTCPAGHPFGIGAKKNPDVDEFPGAPDNPFGWSDLKTAAGGGQVSAGVIPIPEKPGPKNQGFYKFHGWVRIGQDFIAVDPDGYCGG